MFLSYALICTLSFTLVIYELKEHRSLALRCTSQRCEHDPTKQVSAGYIVQHFVFKTKSLIPLSSTFLVSQLDNVLFEVILRKLQENGRHCLKMHLFSNILFMSSVNLLMRLNVLKLFHQIYAALIGRELALWLNSRRRFSFTIETDESRSQYLSREG